MMFPSQSYCSLSVVTLYFFFWVSFVLHNILASSSSPRLQYCRHDQMDALLEFKHEFLMNDNTSLSSWNKTNDCCSWQGVTCDAKSGEVISLLLYSISLNNSLQPNSSLFKLQHLSNLTLRYCNLSGEIPSSLGNLSRLTFLDLSYNNLVGQFPDSIGHLSHLILLDFMLNNLVGPIPASIGNLTKLRYISLAHNKLNGKIPLSFANLTNLSQINLYNNHFESTLPPDMSGFHSLKFFDVGENSFSGPFPTSLFTNPSLEWLNLGNNNFSGPIVFKNTSSSMLENLYLSNNQFSGQIPKSLYEFLHLKELMLRYNNFIGPFPISLFKMPSLSIIDLTGNQLKGPIEFGNTNTSSEPSSIQHLNLAENKFDGTIPESISQFVNLKVLDLSHNSFTGSIPRSMSKLVNLNYLHLDNNKLVGQVPSSFWGLRTVKFSHNSFTSIENFSSSSIPFDETNTVELDLSSNSFQEPFPYWICKLTSLRVLDLSSNTFMGSIPQCLKNSTVLLEELILRDNNFSGALPDIFFNATNLKTLDASHNKLVGKIPKSLINCKAMQIVNMQGNRIKDEFPSWLGSLPSLNVLLLRTNQFYGSLYHHQHNNISSIGFQSLRVIDISHNYFDGTLPSYYFSDWSEMTTLTKKYEDATYMETYLYAGGNYSNSMEIVHKGVDTKFERIRKDFRAIDFSGNMFSGNIPESIGSLKQLRLLNLSGNVFTGNIPQSFTKLTNLEALDLSRNHLSGQIPLAFDSLSFLSVMNFSYNNLEGLVPRGRQIQSQNCSSFMGNPKLYGLEEICGKSHDVTPTPQDFEKLPEQEEQVINWIAAAIAYGPGVFCGLVIGHIFVSHKHEWFMKIFARKKKVVTISHP